MGRALSKISIVLSPSKTSNKFDTEQTFAAARSSFAEGYA